MRFKEWLLSEMVYVFFTQGPQKISIWTDQGVKDVTCDAIDMRFEDWGLARNPNTLQPNPPPSSFSAPLADGRFLNAKISMFSAIGSVGQEPEYQVIRKDWANFADIAFGNTVVKQPTFLRPGDKGFVAATG